MVELRRCTRCVMPETHEAVTFDGSGVCSVCRNQEGKQTVNWNARHADLVALLDAHQGRCIVPMSGGKDSTYQALYLTELCRERYGTKPIVARVNHHFMRPTVEANFERTIRRLGLEVYTYTPPWDIVRKTMRAALIEAGDFCWHCHTTVFTFPLRVALQTGIPLVIYGEASTEYSSHQTYAEREEVDRAHFERNVNLGISTERMAELTGVPLADLAPFAYPDPDALRQLGYHGIHLGDYIPWDVKRHYDIIHAELGWQGDDVEGVPPQYEWEKIECYLQGCRDWCIYVKKGFGRATHMGCIAVRNGWCTRDEALADLAEYEGYRPASLDLLLDFIGMTEDEYEAALQPHTVAPWVYQQPAVADFPPHDFEDWVR